MLSLISLSLCLLLLRCYLLILHWFSLLHRNSLLHWFSLLHWNSLLDCISLDKTRILLLNHHRSIGHFCQSDPFIYTTSYNSTNTNTDSNTKYCKYYEKSDSCSCNCSISICTLFIIYSTIPRWDKYSSISFHFRHCLILSSCLIFHTIFISLTLWFFFLLFRTMRAHSGIYQWW